MRIFKYPVKNSAYCVPYACKVMVRIKDGKKVEHQGIKVEFVGHIGKKKKTASKYHKSDCPLYTIPIKKELYYDRGNHYEFTSLSQELAAPGELRQSATYDFEFKNVEKQFESYLGINAKLRLKREQ